MKRIYLDYQAATPVLPEVEEAMRPYWRELFGSPASMHREGLRVRDALDRARLQVARLIGAESREEIVFTSDGTESVNLALRGLASARQRRGNHLVLSKIEHPATLNSAAFLERQGIQVTRVGVDAEGRLDPEAVREAMTDETFLISVHHANHDLGTIQSVAAIGHLARERRIPLHVDAETSAGWLPLDVQTMGISLLSFSPHRFYGPKGVGVLYRNRRARLVPLIYGGNQEGGLRAGLENVPGIVGAGVAAEVAVRELALRQEWTASLQRRFWEELVKRIPDLHLNGPRVGPGRISTNLNFSVPGIEGEALMLRLDLAGIAVGSGTACVSKALRVSHVLDAIGLDYALAKGNLMVSFGKDNTEAEVDRVLEVMPAMVEKLRALSPGWGGKVL